MATRTYEFRFGHGDRVHGKEKVGIVDVVGVCTGVWEDIYNQRWYMLQWLTCDGAIQERWFREEEVSEP